MRDKPTVLDLFSGIGGFSLGLERAGMETVAFCEIEKYPRKVLAKHWPDIPIYDDVRTLTKERLDNDGITNIDVLCGGFPCQPFSQAGLKQGKDDDRYIWPEVIRVIREVEPNWVILENVDGFISMALAECISNLECAGYFCCPLVIPACAVGLDHRRDRVWIVANCAGIDDSHNIQKFGQISELGEYRQLGSPLSFTREGNKPGMAGEPHGVPSRLDRYRAIGNAVVPQIPEIIGRAIMSL